jgi:hypothetical protein
VLKVPDLDEDQKWYRASFRIVGDLLQPEEISEILGLQATRSARKGEDSGTLLGKPSRISFWMMECPPDFRQPMEDQLKWLLERLEPKADSITALADRFSVEFFCGFSSGNGQGGFELNCTLLARLANLRAFLVLDLYPPSGESHQEGGTAAE